MSLKIIYFAVVAAFIAVIQLLVPSAWGAGLVAAILTVLSHGLWNFLDIGFDSKGDRILPAGAAGMGVWGGVAMSWILGDGARSFNWIVVPVPVVVSLVWI